MYSCSEKIPGLTLPPDLQIGASNKRLPNPVGSAALAEMLDAHPIGLPLGREQRESVFEDTEPVKAEDSPCNGRLVMVAVRCGSRANGSWS